MALIALIAIIILIALIALIALIEIIALIALIKFSIKFPDCPDPCESKEGLWLQGEAAFETHSFRDAEPQPVIPQHDEKIINYLPSSQTRL